MMNIKSSLSPRTKPLNGSIINENNKLSSSCFKNDGNDCFYNKFNGGLCNKNNRRSGFYPENSIGSIITTNNSTENTIKQQSPYVNNSISIFSNNGNDNKIQFNAKNGEEVSSDFGVSEFKIQHKINIAGNENKFRTNSYSPIKIMTSKNFKNKSYKEDLSINLNENNDYEAEDKLFFCNKNMSELLRLSQIAEDDENIDYQSNAERKKNSIDSSSDMNICVMSLGKINIGRKHRGSVELRE